ncbi:MAG: hypothetical protein QOE24_427 [Frankiales bacterium]|nr:hypothetical protein [Frankiales bacterium]
MDNWLPVENRSPQPLAIAIVAGMKMSPAEAAARRRASGQEGVLTWAELRALGVPHHLVRRRVEVGAWKRLHREVYVLRDLVRDPVRTSARAALIAGPDGAITSHLLAGHLHRLQGLPELVYPELTVAQAIGGYSTAGLVVHRTATLEAAPRLVQGFPATTAARTLADLSPTLTLEQLVSAMDSALRMGTVSKTQLEAISRRWVGRPGVQLLAKATPLAAVGSDSPLETRIRLVIVGGGLPEPVLQIVVVVDGDTYRIDMGYLEPQVAIEGDGREPHELPDALFNDRRRQNALSNAGWLPLRFTWHDVINRPGYIVATVAKALSQGSAAGSIAAVSS